MSRLHKSLQIIVICRTEEQSKAKKFTLNSMSAMYDEGFLKAIQLAFSFILHKFLHTFQYSLELLYFI